MYNTFDENKTLATAFETYEKNIEVEIDYSKCVKDSSFMSEVCSYLQNGGLGTDAYFYMLHYLFDVTLKIYAPKPSLHLENVIATNNAGKSIILLKKGIPCTPLCVDRNAMNLANSRLVKSTVSMEILPLAYTAATIDDLSSINSSLDIADVLKESKSQSLACKCIEDDVKIIMDIMKSSQFHAEISDTLKLLCTNHFERFPFLHTLAQRLSYEPVLLNDEEFLFILNKIVTTVCEQTNDEADLHWIFSMSPINHWLSKITILNLENYFQSFLPSEIHDKLFKTECTAAVLLFNKYLTMRSFNKGLSKNAVLEIFHLLSSMQDGEIDVEDLSLNAWPYALRSNYWKIKLRSVDAFESDDAKVSVASSLENKYGTSIVEDLVVVLRDKYSNNLEATYILDAFNTEQWVLRSWVIDILKHFPFEECKQILNKSDDISDHDRTIQELLEMINDNSNGSEKIRITLEEIGLVYEQCKNAEEIKSMYQLNEDQLLNAVKKCDLSRKNYIEYIRALAIVDRGIELFKGLRLRDTQKMAILVLLTTGNNSLLQVSTGEGKSLIVVATAILKSLRSQNVDIITSSTVLAKRDAESMEKLFGYFQITVGHNCQAKVEERREVYSKNRVIYGEVAGFQRDYLLDRFYDKNILGDRKLDNVIVDEVDSMLLDKGNNMLYLSHEICGLDKLQSLYIFIWKHINASGNDLNFLFDTGALKNAVLHDLFGLIQRQDLTKLSNKMSEYDVQNLWSELQTAKLIDNIGKPLVSKPFQLKDGLLPDALRHLEPRIQFLFNEILDREQQIVVPKCFYSFIEHHLDSWLESAKNAFFLVEKQDYVVDVDRSGSHLGQNITILDRNTGTDMTNSQWDEALHQFLQVKHGCKLTPQSLKGVFVSNVTYLKKYNHLSGLTGTLGSKPERELLKDIHDVEFLTIPHNKERKFKELPTLLCADTSEWIEKILEETRAMMAKKRSVLIICDTVQDVNSIYNAMGGKTATNIRTYSREYEDVDLTTGKKSLEPMQILISTNLAGRGTDILLTEELRVNGGLHVCLTYLTGNSRIEEQALGRAARAGDKGTGRIICLKDFGSDGEEIDQNIYELKLKRDSDELRRLSDIKSFYEKQIKIEEKCFDIFSRFYSQVKMNRFHEETREFVGIGADLLHNVKIFHEPVGEFLEDTLLSEKKKVEYMRETVRNFVLKTHLDNWAFWLDKNSNLISSFDTKPEEEKVYDDLRQYLKKATEKDWKTYVSVNPWSATKLGKFLVETGHTSLAVDIFDRVIENEPHYSAFAHYYKATAQSKNIDWKNVEKRKEFENSLLKADNSLTLLNECLVRDAGVVSNIRKEITSGIITVNAFEAQQSSKKLVHEVYQRNIGEYFGVHITPDAFHSDTIDKKCAEDIFKKLTDNGFINNVGVVRIIPNKTLEDVCDQFGIMYPDILKNVLEGFQVKKFEENELIEKLKILGLNSRERFWKEMVDNNVITNVVEDFVVDYAKLKEYNNQLFEKFEYLSTKGSLREFVINSQSSAEQKVCYNVQLHQPHYKMKNDEIPTETRVFLRRSLESAISAKNVVDLEKSEFASQNKFGYFDIEQAKGLNRWRNELDLAYFAKFRIQKSEQDLILKYLVDAKVLEYNSGKYVLNNASEVSSVEPFPIYDYAIRCIISQIFTMRNTLINLIDKVQKGDELPSIALHSCPEKRLYFALVDSRIITLSKVSDKDLEKDVLAKLIWSVIPQKKSTQYEENVLEMAKGALVQVSNYISDEHADVNVNFVHGVLENYQNILKRLEHPAVSLQHVSKFLNMEKDFDYL